MENRVCTCVAGSYQTFNKSECLWCPANSNSGAASAGISDCVCNAGWTGTNGSCAGCMAGKYKPGSGSEACTECAGGFYSAEEQTRCQLCPAKTFSAIGSSAIEACLCNTGWTGTRDECISCVPGKFKPSYGDAACTACDAGRYSNPSAVICVYCEAGKYSSEDRSECTRCPPNSRDVSQSVNITVCSCNAGWSGTDGNCTACVPGKFKLNNGAQSCSGCAAGSYSNTTAVTCVECEAGNYSAADRTECIRCPANTHSAQGSGAISNCSCNPGWTGNNSACAGCLAGKYKPASGLRRAQTARPPSFTAASTQQRTCVVIAHKDCIHQKTDRIVEILSRRVRLVVVFLVVEAVVAHHIPRFRMELYHIGQHKLMMIVYGKLLLLL